MKKLVSQEREKYVKKRKTQGAADKKPKTGDEQLHVMIEEYLQSRVCPKTKKIIKRSVKWDKSLLESCDGPGAPKHGRSVTYQPQTVENELAEFNNFTVKNVTSKEESDYQRMVNSEENTTAAGPISD